MRLFLKRLCPYKFLQDNAYKKDKSTFIGYFDMFFHSSIVEVFSTQNVEHEENKHARMQESSSFCLLSHDNFS